MQMQMAIKSRFTARGKARSAVRSKTDRFSQKALGQMSSSAQTSLPELIVRTGHATAMKYHPSGLTNPSGFTGSNTGLCTRGTSKHMIMTILLTQQIQLAMMSHGEVTDRMNCNTITKGIHHIMKAGLTS